MRRAEESIFCLSLFSSPGFLYLALLTCDLEPVSL